MSLFLVLRFAFTAAVLSLCASHQSGESVLILGAGVSGLQAAATLFSQNITVAVLESRNEIGGRAMTKTFHGRAINVGPMSVNPGAQYIHGTSLDNPIWTLAKSSDCNVSSAPFDYDNAVFYDSDGNGFNTDQEANWADMDRLYKVVDAIGKTPEAYAGLSLKEAYADKWVVNSSMRTAIDWFVVDFEHAANSSQLAADHTYIATYDLFPEGDHLVTDSGGMKKIPECLAKRAKLVEGQNLHLNAKVKKIDYSSDSVVVTTADQKTYSADYVIVTFSAGVLQNQGLEFTPPLPERKQLAFNKMRMGLYTTVYLKFLNNFWSDKLKSTANSSGDVINVIIGTTNRSRVFYYYNLAAFHENWHTLAVVTTGELAAQMEVQPKSKTQDQLMDLLREQFGDSAEDPVDIFVPIWKGDDNFYGSYSYAPVAFKTSDMIDAQASVSERVYFAGEALSKDFYGFLHGAYFSGEDVAKCVAFKVDPTVNITCKFLNFAAGHAAKKASNALLLIPLAIAVLLIG